MNKILLLCALWASFFAVAKAQNIRDYALVSEIMQQCPTCIDGAGNLLPDAANFTHLTLRMQYLTTFDLSDLHYLTGLQFFDCNGAYIMNFNTCPPNLDTLICNNNNLSVLPPLPSSMRYLDCKYNPLVGLPTLPTALTYLDCAANSLASLPTLPSNLIYLDCNRNGLSILPTLPATLIDLYCNNNQWTNLPALPANLEVLVCADNPLTVLPALPTSLTYLNCANNQLNTLPALPQSLNYLNCGYNQIPSLNALPNNLADLICQHNLLTALPTLPVSLENIACNNNQLTALPAFPNGLKTVSCHYNQLTALPAFPLSLTLLDCSFNQITVLPAFPANFRALNCNNNLLTALPALADSLTALHCAHNQITALPVLSNSPRLSIIDCSYNQITALGTLPTILATLYCSYNPNLNCLPWLPGTLQQIYFNNTAISCTPNHPTLYSTTRSLPICVPSNNNNNCLLYNTIEGRVYLDADNDGVFNNNDMPLPNRLVYSNYGFATATDSNGMYALAIGFNSTSTVTIGNWLNTAYYSVTPNSYIISTNNSTQQFTNNDFRIVALSANNDVRINLNYGRYRPGFNNTFSVTYENVGNTVADGEVIITLDNQLAFLSANPSPNVVQLGRQLTFNYNNLQPFERRVIFIEVNLPATASIGDILITRGTISSNNADVNLANNTFNAREIAVGSYDPNDINADKRAICMDLPDEIYRPITYKIRFQNTGTFYAEKVVVTDTLSTMLDIRTFQQLNCSHDYRLEIENILRDGQPTQVLKWIFDDIFLLDSFTNEPLSHGFVNYRISPKTTPAINYGNVINSQAHIYFDFNPAVNTNINALVAQNCLNSLYEIPANDYNFNILPNPNNGIFSLQVDKLQPTASQAFVYNNLGQIVYQQNISTNLPEFNLSHLQAGVYNLQIVNEHSTATKSFVISR